MIGPDADYSDHYARRSFSDRRTGIDLEMMMKFGFSRLLAGVALVALTSLGSANMAVAQQDSGWLWSGSETPGGSGRQTVRFNPQYAAGQIIVSFGDRRLYHIQRPGEATSYPIAIPREQSRWQGTTNVSQKRENPGWTPTAEMRRENPRLPNWVPGGHPMNPLGVRALYLGSSMYRIHGTDAPWTIGSAVSKGCIRMYNQDVAELYPRVNVGAKVIVTWQTFRTSTVADANEPTEEKKKYRRSDTRKPDQDSAASKRVLPKRTAQRTKSAEMFEMFE